VENRVKNGEVKIGENMYVIIENGGKQYKAVEGAYIEIDLLPEEVGKKKTFDKVLLLSTDEKVEVGVPYIKGASVDATITSHFKGPKITVFKYRPKQRFRVKTGHRQQYTRVLVDSIAFPGKPAEAPKKAEATESVEKPVEKKAPAAPKKTAAAKKAAEPAKKAATKTGTTKKSTAAKTKPAADKK
jgi:large subunit ribosomal protein L21